MVYTLRFLIFKMQFVSQFVTYLVPLLFTFDIQGVLKLKINSGAKRLIPDNKKLALYIKTCVPRGILLRTRNF